MAVVDVLASARTKDKVLAACATNIWPLFNISLQLDHIPGRDSTVADLLSRFKFDQMLYFKLNKHIPHPHWIPKHIDLTCLNYGTFPVKAQLTTRAFWY